MKFTRIDHGDYYEEIYDPNLAQHDDPGWPAPANAALYGLAGEVVTWLIPNTEADQAALLLQFLVSFGNVVGRGPHFLVEGTKHYSNLFIVLAGQTAKARKSTSADRIRQLFEAADPEWAQLCVRGGISSGEGIIWAIRDSIYSMKKGELQCTDAGVDDKRYSEASTKLIFGDTVGDPLADEILRALRSCFITGMTRTELVLMFRNSPHRAAPAGGDYGIVTL